MVCDGSESDGGQTYVTASRQSLLATLETADLDLVYYYY